MPDALPLHKILVGRSVLEQRAGAWDSAMPAAIARETGLRRRLAELVQRVAELEGRREA